MYLILQGAVNLTISDNNEHNQNIFIENFQQEAYHDYSRQVEEYLSIAYEFELEIFQVHLLID